MTDRLNDYDRGMEQRDVVKVRHLRRIADALEAIAAAAQTNLPPPTDESTPHPAESTPHPVRYTSARNGGGEDE